MFNSAVLITIYNSGVSRRSAIAGTVWNETDPVWVDEPVQDPNRLWLATTEGRRRMRANPDLRRRIARSGTL
jgi:hypothetical protein